MKASVKFDTGVEITLRPTVGKKGQVYLAARPESEPFVTHYGINVKAGAVGGSLPKTATLVVDGKPGTTVKLDKGFTEKGNAKVTGDLGSITLDDEEQKVTLRMSQPNPSTINVLIRSARPNSRVVDSL